MRGAIRAFEPASLLSTAYFIPAYILATTDPQTAQDSSQSEQFMLRAPQMSERVDEIGGTRLLNICC